MVKCSSASIIARFHYSHCDQRTQFCCIFHSPLWPICSSPLASSCLSDMPSHSYLRPFAPAPPSAQRHCPHCWVPHLLLCGLHSTVVRPSLTPVTNSHSNRASLHCPPCSTPRDTGTHSPPVSAGRVRPPRPRAPFMLRSSRWRTQGAQEPPRLPTVELPVRSTHPVSH